jgi:hypothetical protein
MGRAAPPFSLRDRAEGAGLTMFRTSVIACSIGLALGILFGVLTTWLLPTNTVGPDNSSVDIGESVNQRTGKPQVHLQGKPEIK